MSADREAIAAAFAARAPEPERFERFAADLEALAAAADAPLHPDLCAVALGYGTFLPRVARIAPGPVLSETAYARLQDGAAAVLADAARPNPEHELKVDLRWRRNVALARVALAQSLGLWTPEQVWTCLSDLADAWIDEAYAAARTRVVARFGELHDRHGAPVGLAILGFGKLGSRELNFSSDVDLVFVGGHNGGESVGGADGTVDAETWVDKVCRRTVALIDEHDEHGFVFRVDLRLRPDGSRGRLVPGAEAFVDYYPNWSSTWERIALLRARPVAGDRALGERVLAQLEGYVYPRHLDFESLEDMRRIKEKINREAARKGQDGIDLKLGAGGIRELEFLVQNLQIIFGGKEAHLRTRGTLAALQALCEIELMPAAVAVELRDAYTRLRHFENVLQARDDRQTQLLPDDPAVRREVARACGLLGDDPAATLAAELEAIRARVGAEFAQLYHQGDRRDEPPIRPEVYELIEHQELDEDGRANLLTALGFADADTAQGALQRLLSGPKASVYGMRAREQFERILPILLDAVARSPNPDQSLRFVGEFINRVGGRSYLYALLRENPQVIQAVATLFAGSAYLARFFTAHPELLDQLVLRSHAVPVRPAAELHRLVATAAAEADDPEDAADALRRVRLQETLRIGWHDLIGSSDLLDVHGQLTQLAAAIVAEVRDLGFAALAGRYDVQDAWRGELVPIALGKLGSGEMNYMSDLDLIFVTGPGGALPLEMAIRWAQKMLTILQSKSAEGFLYEADMRLRPSGGQGLLVTTFDAFRSYHDKQAQVWERVALVKRRVLDEGPAGVALAAEIDRICFEPPLGADDVEAMAAIRAKMEAERGSTEPFKAGPGGTADLEFLIALAQLRWGRELPALRAAHPQQALGAFAELPAPFPALGTMARRALYAYRLLETRVHLLLDRPTSRFPDRPAQQAALAASLGFADPDAMHRFYGELSREVRAGFEQGFEALRNT